MQKPDNIKQFIQELSQGLASRLETLSEKGLLPDPVQAKAELQNTITAFTNATIEKYELVSREEFQALQNTLSKLQARVEKMEKSSD
ncbi:MAG: hypothetical protein QM538_05875 [Methylacidiphilales bacterium]|nr:hypothetical protein [Candidatus Methylacidiphilales bacterium]